MLRFISCFTFLTLGVACSASPNNSTTGSTSNGGGTTGTDAGGTSGDGTTGTSTGGTTGTTTGGTTGSTATFTLSGQLTGLALGRSVELFSGDFSAVVSTNGSFTLSTTVPSGTMYDVQVRTQPLFQDCTVQDGSGTIADGDVSSVTVNCITTHAPLGGTVSGLQGDGLTLALNGTPIDTLAALSTEFSVAGALLVGSSPTLTIATQPTAPSQTCVLSGGGASQVLPVITEAGVNTIAVICTTNTYALSGVVNGLRVNGLTLANGVDEVTLNPDPGNPVAFSLPAIASGESYAITVDHTDGRVSNSTLTQRCTVTAGATGTVQSEAVANIVVTCVNQHLIRVQTTGLSGGTNLALTVDGDQETLAITTNGDATFSMYLDTGAEYALAIVPVVPTAISCVLGAEGGTASGNTTIISVSNTCSPYALAPVYPSNGANWNTRVLNNGVDQYSGSDAACTGTLVDWQTCVHGGELKQLVLTGVNSCTDITASDSLDVFGWRCLPGTPVRIVSTGLKPGKGLRDLLVFDSPPTWRSLGLSVSHDSTVIVTVAPTVAWTNPIDEWNQPTAPPADGFFQTGRVAVFTEDVFSTDAAPLVLREPRSSVVTKPGVQVDGQRGNIFTVLSLAPFAWLELDFAAVSAIDTPSSSDCFNVQCVQLYIAAEGAVVRNSTMAGAGRHGIFVPGAVAALQFLDVKLTGTALTASPFLVATSGSLFARAVFNAPTATDQVRISGNRNVMHALAFKGSAISEDYGQSNQVWTQLTMAEANSAWPSVLVASGGGSVFAQSTVFGGPQQGLAVQQNSSWLTFNSVAVVGAEPGIQLSDVPQQTVLRDVASIPDVSGNFAIATSFLSRRTAADDLEGAGWSLSHRVAGTIKVGIGTGLDGGMCSNEPAENPAAGLGFVDSTCSTFLAFGPLLTNGAPTGATFHPNALNGGIFVGNDAWQGLAFNDQGDPNGGGAGTAGPVLLNALGTGMTVQEHAWFANSIECAKIRGATFDGALGCYSRFLDHAFEIVGDGRGNDNGLCESHEACIFTPNIGAYQGHGAAVLENADLDVGTVQNVQLYRHADNGY